jgi:uncharacterized protein YqeY
VTLREIVQEELKTAMKNREALKLSVIRLVKAAMMNLEIARGHQLDDSEVIEVLSKEAKQRKDSIPEFEKANRPDLVAQLQAELQILEAYLPAQLSEAELRQLVAEAVLTTGAVGRKDMGKVMAVLMPQIKGKADGKLVNRLVTAALEPTPE